MLDEVVWGAVVVPVHPEVFTGVQIRVSVQDKRVLSPCLHAEGEELES